MRVVPLAAALAGLLVAGTAPAETLDEMCQALDASPAAECELDGAKRRQAPGWELKTSLLLNGGSSAQVKRVETRFCETANRLGFVGWVTRWNRLSAHSRGGAVMTWSCVLPVVSTGPPQ